jgi:F420H(2)-dependent biliverdin reductase
MNSIPLTSEQFDRIEKSQIIWLASVRPDGSPHLAPLWFVWHQGRTYICTPSETVKSRNIALNPRIVLSLEDGNHPLIIEGEARRLETIPPRVAELFSGKYDWEIVGDETNDALFEIVPSKILTW